MVGGYRPTLEFRLYKLGDLGQLCNADRLGVGCGGRRRRRRSLREGVSTGKQRAMPLAAERSGFRRLPSTTKLGQATPQQRCVSHSRLEANICAH